MNGCKRLTGLRAFTLVEAVLSMAIVSVMLVAALSMVGAKRLGEYKTATSNQGLSLAQDLMAEILQYAYEEPYDTVVFGPETGEGTTNRVLYDDVDDYHGWSASPPEDPNGTAMNGLTGWGRSVSVAWLDPYDLSQTVGSDQNVKRIRVTSIYNGVPVSVLDALRTTVWSGVPAGN
jgi:type II secretory pathway pseudopilin PulG